MLLNLLTICAFFGIAAASYGSNNNYAAAANPPQAFFFPRHHRGHHWRRSSSESDEKWDCARLGVFNVTYNNLTSAPQIAYYTQQGKEKAIAVCGGVHIQSLLGQSRDANVPAGVTNPTFKDVAFLSLSTRAGLTFSCNKRSGRYEAFNLITRQTIPIDALACLSLPEEERAAILYPLVQLLAWF